MANASNRAPARRAETARKIADAKCQNTAPDGRRVHPGNDNDKDTRDTTAFHFSRTPGYPAVVCTRQCSRRHPQVESVVPAREAAHTAAFEYNNKYKFEQALAARFVAGLERRPARAGRRIRSRGPWAHTAAPQTINRLVATASRTAPRLSGPHQNPGPGRLPGSWKPGPERRPSRSPEKPSPR